MLINSRSDATTASRLVPQGALRKLELLLHCGPTYRVAVGSLVLSPALSQESPTDDSNVFLEVSLKCSSGSVGPMLSLETLSSLKHFLVTRTCMPPHRRRYLSGVSDD